MVQFKIARLTLVALICLFSLAPIVSADNTVRSSKNADGSTKWEAIDDDSVEAGAAAPPPTPVYSPAPAGSGGKTNLRTGGGGGVSLHRNKDGSIETYSAGPSGVIPPGGFTDDGPIGDGGGYSGGGGGGGSYGGGGGVTVKRNADGSIETSSAGPSGSWGGGGGGARRARRPVAHKVAQHKPAAAPAQHKGLQAMQAKAAPTTTAKKSK